MTRRPSIDETPPAPRASDGTALEPSAWEANELRRLWSFAHGSLDEAVGRLERIAAALDKPEANRHRLDPTGFANAAQAVVEAAAATATLLARYDGIVHRYALERHEAGS